MSKIKLENIKELKKKDFPERLREIPKTPEKLFLLGDLPETEKYLCVIGARKYTSYGEAVVEKLIRGLKGYDITIVSGLAIGIDSLAHKAALENGLKTIAIPGSGLGPKVLYPGCNLLLAEKILNHGGALLSEFPNDFKATTWSFPQRNRLMAGIAHAVLVIEAEKKSGTLITTKLATDYNRDILAVPGSILSSTSEGPNFLLQMGATPVTCSEDILTALGFDTDEKSAKNFNLELFDCSENEKSVLQALSSPKERDELATELDLPLAELNSLLTILEIKNLIKEKQGQIYLNN